MNPTPVDRCVCNEVTFAEILALAKLIGPSIDQLSKRTGCCTGCGMCRPYILVALATGRTRLPVMTPVQLELARQGLLALP